MFISLSALSCLWCGRNQLLLCWSQLYGMLIFIFVPLNNCLLSRSPKQFLPAKKVTQKAEELRSYLAEDVLSSTTSANILVMTFRQVVLHQLWNFEFALFRPGTKRNMKDLENAREVLASFNFSSSDEHIISMLAEVVLSAFESAEINYLDNSFGRSSSNLFRLFKKPERFTSKDSSVILYKFLEDELVGNAKSVLKEFKSMKAHDKPVAKQSILNWWTSSIYSKLEKIGGPGFSTWVREYVPAYRLQINSDKLDKLKFEGGQNLKTIGGKFF